MSTSHNFFIGLAALSALRELRPFVVAKPSNSLFFNKKLNSFLAARERQLLQALREFGGRVELIIQRQVGGGQFT